MDAGGAGVAPQAAEGGPQGIGQGVGITKVKPATLRADMDVFAEALERARGGKRGQGTGALPEQRLDKLALRPLNPLYGWRSVQRRIEPMRTRS